MNSYVRVVISTRSHPYGHMNSYLNMSSHVSYLNMSSYVNMNSYVRVVISTLTHPYGHMNSYINMSSYVHGNIDQNKI
jgi:hypothetical protein